MRRHTRMLVPATLCALVAVLTLTPGAGVATARHATAGPVSGGTLHVAFGGDMTSFDPAQAVSNDWYLVTGALFNGLYQDDRNGKPQLDLADVPATSHPLPLINVTRPDVPRPSLSAEDALAGAPAAQEQRFRVPRILEED